ncbi:type IV conjugative transfer system lipoprotein TraV [Vibrio parahaemolyticus]|uniref:type IV conjugative transfer system lipoprotein TraV n=1 Tax=Vibrio parahaemolyticus TaxID=670 RepID=UPI0009A9A06A|nr:type IV conjugative transfer system lipoprotein TraV [Vibrio parahaemolyticus]
MTKKTQKPTRKGSFTGGVPMVKPIKSTVSMILGSALLLSGCTSIGSDEYSCSGIPDGVQCMSARDVYAATNDGNIPRSVKPGEEPVSVSGEIANSSSTGDSVIDNYVTPRLPNRPVPIRTPAQVMRIWVAPWEDTNGDLIVTGYVYTEIEPRKWVIGEGTQQDVPMLKPLQTIKPKANSETK